MKDYASPSFYPFSEDSIFLTKFIIQNEKREFDSILDLGTGCGVIALELAHHYRPSALKLVELQKEFTPYLEKNFAFKCIPFHVQGMYWGSFSQFLSENQEKFDLIVSNPPYYDPHSHLLPPDQNKAHCRFFLKDNYEILISIILKNLKPNGKGYILIKNSEMNFYANQVSGYKKCHPLTKDVSVLEYSLNIE